MEGAKNCAHSFSSLVGMKSNLEDLLFNFRMTLCTAVTVTGSKTEKVGTQFVSGMNEESAALKPSLANAVAISSLIEINLSLKNALKALADNLHKGSRPLTTFVHKSSFDTRHRERGQDAADSKRSTVADLRDAHSAVQQAI